MILWLEFIVCTSLIVYSGIKLSKYGDIIAEKTGLGMCEDNKSGIRYNTLKNYFSRKQ